MNLKKIKEVLNKFWFYVWQDDSPRGWFISLIFIIILIKFILFPALEFTTGTELPLAIVESCSMHHQGNFLSNINDWWQPLETKYSQFNITKNDFNNFNFKKGFTKGDILFIIEAKPENLKVGDVIIFEAGRQNPLIHRIVKIQKTSEEYIFSTIGDNNSGQLSEEKSITEDQLMGKAVIRIAPYAGWVKLIFFEHMQPDYNKGFCE